MLNACTEMKTLTFECVEDNRDTETRMLLRTSYSAMKGTPVNINQLIESFRRVIRHSRGSALILTLMIITGLRADAGFIAEYGFSHFTLMNTDADGTAFINIDGSLVLVGGNNGSGAPGMTDFSILAPASGPVSFNYAYASLDIPGYDFAAIVADTFTMLASSDGASGSFGFIANAGEKFGFRVTTLDNTGEPGILTISNFNAPSVVLTDTPEPSSAIPLVLTLAAVAEIKRRAGTQAQGDRKKS